MNPQDPQFPSGSQPGHERLSRRSNPLRRPSDRAQSWFSGLLLLVLLLGLPAASVSAGWATYTGQLRVVRTEAAERHQVTARLIETTADAEQQTGEDGYRGTPVTWTEKNGMKRVGTARVAAGAEADDTVRIWVDRAGIVTRAPMPVSSAITAGWLAGGLTAGATALVLYGARTGLRRTLDRRRYAQWDAEWRLLEPRWSGRFRR